MNQKGFAALILIIVFAGILIFGTGIWYFSKKSSSTLTPNTSSLVKEEQPVSKHPWPQFHGSYFHTGYAAVNGPQKATLKWKFNIGKMEGSSANSVVISADGTIYVAGAGKIFALDKNGKVIWSKSYPNTQGPALSEDGTIYFLSGDAVVALDKNGKEQWQFKTKGNTIIGLTVGPDGTIYQGSWDGYFYAINKDGTLKWKYKTAGAVSYPASIDKNGIIYLGGGDAHAGPDSNLYAFNSDGTLKWKYDTKAMRVGSPAIGSDGLIYIPAAPSLIVLDSSGNLKWKKSPEVSSNNVQAADTTKCGAPPLPACNGGQPQGGNVPASPVECGTPPLPPCSGVNQPQNGNLPQPLEGAGDIAGIISPAVASDGTIYVGNAQGILSAFDPKTQKIKWTYQAGSDPNQPGFYGLPSFPLVDKTGTVYFGSVDGKMYSVGKDGKLLWKYQTAGKITEASPAFDSDGVLYFTSEDGYLYAIGN